MYFLFRFPVLAAIIIFVLLLLSFALYARTFARHLIAPVSFICFFHSLSFSPPFLPIHLPPSCLVLDDILRHGLTVSEHLEARHDLSHRHEEDKPHRDNVALLAGLLEVTSLLGGEGLAPEVGLGILVLVA